MPAGAGRGISICNCQHQSDVIHILEARAFLLELLKDPLVHSQIEPERFSQGKIRLPARQLPESWHHKKKKPMAFQ